MPKYDLSKASEEMARYTVRGKVCVKIGWIGEGNSGDYDESDPNDVPLLRFDAYDFAVHKKSCECGGGEACYDRSPRCRSAQDASYCTQLPAMLPRNVLKSVCRAIAKSIAGEESWKRKLEEWSWIDEPEARRLYAKKGK